LYRTQLTTFTGLQKFSLLGVPRDSEIILWIPPVEKGCKTLLWAANGHMGFKNGNNINIKLQGSQSFCGTVQHITLRMLKLTLAKK
jgi:hypothetical protein